MESFYYCIENIFAIPHFNPYFVILSVSEKSNNKRLYRYFAMLSMTKLQLAFYKKALLGFNLSRPILSLRGFEKAEAIHAFRLPRLDFVKSRNDKSPPLCHCEKHAVYYHLVIARNTQCFVAIYNAKHLRFHNFRPPLSAICYPYSAKRSA